MNVRINHICVECGRPLHEHHVSIVAQDDDPEYPHGYTEYICPVQS